MTGELSIMDWVALTALSGAVVAGITCYKAFQDSKRLSKEHTSLSKEHQSIQKDATYLSDVIKDERRAREALYRDTSYVAKEIENEKTARQELYKNSSRAKEILETMDMMKEVVLQNAQLNAEICDLKIQNQELVQSQEEEHQSLLYAISQFRSELAKFGEYVEADDIRSTLRKIQNELSAFNSKSK